MKVPPLKGHAVGPSLLAPGRTAVVDSKPRSSRSGLVISPAARLGDSRSRSGSREAELQAGKEELAVVAQLLLLGRPGPGLVLTHPSSTGHKVRDDREDGDPEGLRAERRGGKGIALRRDPIEARCAEPPGEGLGQ